MVEADDFLSILIYVILKSKCSEILPLLEIVSSFTLNEKQKEIDYMKASLLAAVEYINYDID